MASAAQTEILRGVGPPRRRWSARHWRPDLLHSERHVVRIEPKHLCRDCRGKTHGHNRFSVEVAKPCGGGNEI